MKINIGCSDALLPGWVNVDITPPADVVADLNKVWPWPDNHADEIRAFHVLEHFKSPIHTMNEAWRVLKPGGKFDITVPTTDGRGWAQDPGHICWPPWNRNSFFYYTKDHPCLVRFAPANGVKCAYRVLSENHYNQAGGVVILNIVLEAAK